MAMTNSDQARAPRGTVKLEQIMQAAKRLFLEHGVATTTMDAVAREAGVSKATLYSYFRSRDELFGAVVEALDDRFTASLISGVSGSEDLRVKLLRFGRTVLELLLHPETISAYRTVVAEAARFPELGEVFYANGACRLLDRLERFFASAMESGLLRPAHPRRAAEQFVGLVRGDLMLRALLGISRSADAAEIDAIVASGVDTFCRAYLAA